MKPILITGSVLALVLSLGYRCYFYLKNGANPELDLFTFGISFQVDGWIGVQKILNHLVDAPIEIFFVMFLWAMLANE